ncbi:MAG: VCBS repeat-containing protein [Arhodomonas sp.]|nr:VCBS repeat-containing protein [Arhodomonas sp.]
MHYPSNARLDDDGDITCLTISKRPEHRAEGDALGRIGPNTGLSREDINALDHMYRRNDQTNAAGDRFGETILGHDFDGDGYPDLAVGAPAKGQTGAVQLYKGTADGYVFWKRLDPPDATARRFGTAMAAADFDLDGTVDLAVGAPGTATNGRLPPERSSSTLSGLAWRRPAENHRPRRGRGP